jgi:hypothetical protein
VATALEIWSLINHELVLAKIEHAETVLKRELDGKAKRPPNDVWAARTRFQLRLEFHERRLELHINAFREAWLEMNDEDEPRLGGIVYEKHLQPLIAAEHQRLRQSMPSTYIQVDAPERQWPHIQSIEAPDEAEFRLKVSERLAAIEKKWRNLFVAKPVNDSGPKLQKTTSTSQKSRAALKAERVALVNEYKAAGARIGVKITEKEIAIAAGWSERSPVSKWKSGNPRSTAGDDSRIRRALKELLSSQEK